MKNISGILAGIILLFLFSACNKNYTCRCDGGALGTGKNITIENKSREAAEQECDSYNSGGALNYHNCHLK